MPLSTHPLNPASGSKCSTGQAGRVWFLGGVVNSGGTVTRRCRIPARTRLVVAVANVECSTLEPDPFGGSDAASLRACAHGVVVPNSRLFVKRRLATLDGRRLRLRRAPTRPFAFTVPGPSDNLLACAPMCRGTTGTAAADGYLVLLDPLPAGRHRLHLLGSFPAFRFVLNITYRLTVVGRRG